MTCLLSERATRLLERSLNMPSAFVMGALEGNLWLSELSEARELGRSDELAVVALMKSKINDEKYVDVVCGLACPHETAEAVASYASQEGEVVVATSRPEVLDGALRADRRLYLGSQTVFLTMAVDRSSFLEAASRIPELSITLLDEHDLKAAEGLLMGWDEKKALQARDLVMRGIALGAWLQDRLVGIVGTYSTTTRWWYLGSLFVHPKFRGRGIGTRLASEVTKEALERAGAAVATVEAWNVTSMGLLARLGYRTTSVDVVAVVQSRA